MNPAVHTIVMPGNDPEDERSGGPPPDASDRTWVHPTELTSFVATRRRRSTRRARWVALAAGLAVVAGVAGVVVLLTRSDTTQSAKPAARSGAVQRIVASLTPSVVAVRMTRGDDTTKASGVCVQAGQILTSAPSLEGATSVSVITADGHTLPAAEAARDPVTDLALLTVDAASTYPATLVADRKSTRLNSSHAGISYTVFC